MLTSYRQRAGNAIRNHIRCKDYGCRLEPVSDVSILLLDLCLNVITSFTANRVDRTYEIDSDGKFVLVDTKRYKAKTYTREMLEDKAYNIYSDKGTEE